MKTAPQSAFSSARLDSFFVLLREAKSALLMLDYDGTLAPFTPKRDQAVPYPGVKDRLLQIQHLPHTRLVLISGRAAHDLSSLLEMEITPEIWGSHGCERLYPSGAYETTSLGEEEKSGLAEILHFLQKSITPQHIEEKPFSVAIHWRGLNENERGQFQETTERCFYQLKTELLTLHYFDGGIEIRPEGKHKGVAVKTLLAEMEQPCAAAYLGDDRTDDDAFQALGHNGLKILISNKKESPYADLRLSPPKELIAFLDRWIANGKKEKRE